MSNATDTTTYDNGNGNLSPMLSLMVLGLVVLLSLSIIVCASLVAFDIWKEAKNSRSIDTAMSSPAFIEMASRAGYRIKKSVGLDAPNRISFIQAQCVRSDASGPLPCDPMPSMPGDAEVPVRVSH